MHLRSQPSAGPLARQFVTGFRPVIAALVLGVAALAVPTAAPSPVAGLGPLPACRIDDILTIPRDYESGPHTLVDHILSLGRDYKPPDLVSVRKGGVAGGGYVRELAIDDLRAMARAAEANGTPLVAWSPYRRYRTQVRLFNDGVDAYGIEVARSHWARPGHSEHQLGLAIDFVAVGDTGLTSNWEVTPTGGWMVKNAWKYGWIMSYPKGKIETTCFSYEPWHYRYVGRDVATEIHDSGLTIREYLWTHFTTVDPETGEPLASATAEPSASTVPSELPEVSPTAAPVTSPGSLTQAPGSSPSPTLTPVSVVGPMFGLDPPAAIAAVLLVLTSVGLVAALGFLRRSRPASRRRGSG